MNALKTAVIGLTLISGVTLARADVITDWNKAAIDVMQAVNVAGNPWTRTLAMMHVSMSDSVNAIQDRYGRFTPELPKDPNASAEAAAAAAAREILVRQYPDQKARIDEALGPRWRASQTALRGPRALPWARKSQPPSSPIVRTMPPMPPTPTAL